MDLIADTDILSTFGKINSLHLLQKLFPNSKFYISFRNEAELLEAKKLGYTFITRVVELDHIKVSLNKNEQIEFLKLKENKKTLSSADIESLVLAKSRSLVILTNDINIQKEAAKQGISYFNLPMILRELWKQGILTKEDINKLISQIEKEDNIIIVDKETIFTE